MEIKFCRRCLTDKSTTEFNKDKSRVDGLQRYCRVCTRMITRKFKERKAQKEGRIMKPYEEMKFPQVSDEELFMYLRKFTEENSRPPTTSDLEGNPDYPCAYTYYRRFRYKVANKNKIEGWNAILALAGIEPVDYFSIWRAWEYLVECVVKQFESEYIFQCNSITIGFRPDIVIPSKKLIIDAVTSNYDSKVKQRQLKFAKQYGYRVEFWYLYKTETHGIEAPHLTYIFVDEIIERLRGINQQELIRKIETLLAKHETYSEEILEHKKKYIKSRILIRAKELNRIPKTRDFINCPGFPATTTITKTFGTFNNALLYSGFEPQQVNKFS